MLDTSLLFLNVKTFLFSGPNSQRPKSLNLAMEYLKLLPHPLGAGAHEQRNAARSSSMYAFKHCITAASPTAEEVGLP